MLHSEFREQFLPSVSKKEISTLQEWVWQLLIMPWLQSVWMCGGISFMVVISHQLILLQHNFSSFSALSCQLHLFQTWRGLLLSVFSQQQTALHRDPLNLFSWKSSCTHLPFFLAKVCLQMAHTKCLRFFTHSTHFTSGYFWVLSWTEGSHFELKVTDDDWKRCTSCYHRYNWSLFKTGGCEAVLSNSLETGVHRELSFVFTSGNWFLFLHCLFQAGNRRLCCTSYSPLSTRK